MTGSRYKFICIDDLNIKHIFIKSTSQNLEQLSGNEESYRLITSLKGDLDRIFFFKKNIRLDSLNFSYLIQGKLLSNNSIKVYTRKNFKRFSNQLDLIRGVIYLKYEILAIDLPCSVLSTHTINNKLHDDFKLKLLFCELYLTFMNKFEFSIINIINADGATEIHQNIFNVDIYDYKKFVDYLGGDINVLVNLPFVKSQQRYKRIYLFIYDKLFYSIFILRYVLYKILRKFLR